MANTFSRALMMPWMSKQGMITTRVLYKQKYDIHCPDVTLLQHMLEKDPNIMFGHIPHFLYMATAVCLHVCGGLIHDI